MMNDDEAIDRRGAGHEWPDKFRRRADAADRTREIL